MSGSILGTMAASAVITCIAGAASADALADFQATVETAGAALQAGVQGVSNAGSVPLLEGKSIGAACLGSQITTCVQWWS